MVDVLDVVDSCWIWGTMTIAQQRRPIPVAQSGAEEEQAVKFEVVPDTERPSLRHGPGKTQWDDVVTALAEGKTVKIGELKNANSLNNLRDIWKKRQPGRKLHASMKNGTDVATVWAD